jgi:hypothetical protein
MYEELIRFYTQLDSKQGRRAHQDAHVTDDAGIELFQGCPSPRNADTTCDVRRVSSFRVIELSPHGHVEDRRGKERNKTRNENGSDLVEI